MFPGESMRTYAGLGTKGSSSCPNISARPAAAMLAGITVTDVTDCPEGDVWQPGGCFKSMSLVEPGGSSRPAGRGVGGTGPVLFSSIWAPKPLFSKKTGELRRYV